MPHGLDIEVHDRTKEPDMLTAFTSLAMLALAIHTKRIYANAMEAMLGETRDRPGVQRRDAP
jgi:hypothetical protein